MSVPHIIHIICMPQISHFYGDLTKFWQKQVGTFLGQPCIFDYFVYVLLALCDINMGNSKMSFIHSSFILFFKKADKRNFWKI